MANPDVIKVTVLFHGPFRVATGVATPGTDETVNREDLLPASSLKGLMRASAVRLLPHRPELIHRTFGLRRRVGPRTPTEGQEWADDAATSASPLAVARADDDWDGSSPWHWSAADLGGVRILPRARIAVDPRSGAARRDFLAIGEEVWAGRGEFVITRTGHLDSHTRDIHRTVLACAAAGVHGLGGDRRRGLGWVTFRPEEPKVDDVLLRWFAELRTGADTRGDSRAPKGKANDHA